MLFLAGLSAFPFLPVPELHFLVFHRRADPIRNLQWHEVHMELPPKRPLPFISHDLAQSQNTDIFHAELTARLVNKWRRPALFDGLPRLTLYWITVPSHHLVLNTGFAFIYMDDERDAEDAIRGLDRTEFGRQGRRLRVEWTKQERGGGRSGSSSKRPSANTKPSKTLFVINFDPINTRTRDLERHFDPYGKISNVRIRRNFAFIQYETQEDASKALDATNMSKLMDRVISVEYAIRDDDERRNGYSPDRRGRDWSPDGSGDRVRSQSPYRRVQRASPDYGRGPSPYSKPEQRGSPNYGRGESPVYGRSRSHSPPGQAGPRS